MIPNSRDTSVWLDALRASSRRLRDTVAALPEPLLDQPAFPRQWSVAQVLSHLGSAAEICAALVERGITGDLTGPAAEWLSPIWQRWDRMDRSEQRSAWQRADQHHLALLESLDAGRRGSPRVPYFSGRLDLASYLGYRLSEQSVHAWDVQVALDQAATIPAPEVTLLWERLDVVATRFRDAPTLCRLRPAQVEIRLTEPSRVVSLHLDAELHLYPCEAVEPTSVLSGSAEAVLRLVYGRYRPADDIQVTGALSLTDLTDLFPGY